MEAAAKIQVLANQYIKTPTSSNFTKLYNRVDKILRFFILRYLKDLKTLRDRNDILDEIIQKTYIIILHSLDSYQESKANFVTWMFSVAKHEIIKYFKLDVDRHLSIEEYFTSESGELFELNQDLFYQRRKTSKRFDKDILDTDAIKGVGVDEIIDDFLTDFEYNDLENKQRCHQILEGIKNIPKKYADALTDKFINKLSYAEIAIKYNVPLNTVRTLIKKGREFVLIEIENNELENKICSFLKKKDVEKLQLKNGGMLIDKIFNKIPYEEIAKKYKKGLKTTKDLIKNERLFVFNTLEKF